MRFSEPSCAFNLRTYGGLIVRLGEEKSGWWPFSMAKGGACFVERNCSGPMKCAVCLNAYNVCTGKFGGRLFQKELVSVEIR